MVHRSLRVTGFTCRCELNASQVTNAETIVSGRVWLLAPFRNSTSKEQFRALQLRYGARVRVATSLDHTGNYRNPGVSTLSEYLERREYDATGIVRGSASIVRLDDTRVFKPLAWLYEWRERLQRAIDSRFAPETAGVLDAALLGNRYNLSRSASERFREGGTFHVLVISGLHITFLGGIVFLAARRLTSHRLLQFLLPAIVVWSYSFAVGAEASVVRAALMFSFAGLAAIIFRQPNVAERTRCGGVGPAHSQPERDLRSFVPTNVFVSAGDCRDRVAVADEFVCDWCVASDRTQRLFRRHVRERLKSFCEILFWSERKWKNELDRSSHHYCLVQDEVRCVAGALLSPTLLALRVWRDCSFRKCSGRVVATDDCLLSPAIARISVVEYRCQYFARGACCGRAVSAPGFAGQPDDFSTAIQACGRNQLVDGPQRRSVFRLRSRCLFGYRNIRVRRRLSTLFITCLCCYLSSRLHTGDHLQRELNGSAN